MSAIPVLPPDGAAWNIRPVPLDGGRVGLQLAFDLGGEEQTVTLEMERTASRALADAIYAAGGDGTMRTFSPASAEQRHG